MLILVCLLDPHEPSGLNWTAGSRQRQRVVLDIAGLKRQQRPPGLGFRRLYCMCYQSEHLLPIEGCTFCPTKLGMYLYFGLYLTSFFGQEKLPNHFISY